MRLARWSLALWALGAGLLPVEAIACGDKFLVIGRGARRVPKARHPATIALYLRAGSELPAVVRQMHLVKTLEHAGHEVIVVVEEKALRERMASRRVDFVIAELGDAGPLAQALPGDGPLVVPVDGGDAPKAAYAGYPLVIRAGKSLSYLAALDAAMAARSTLSSLRPRGR